MAVQKIAVTVVIDHTSKWGNPFMIGGDGDRDGVIEKYRSYINHPINALLKSEIIHELKGQVLGCWCKPLDCHGDILAAIANGEEG
ncbi:MAG: DUF4326 domain-containing protein [Nitrospinae bacterium]|nr:DUF4326 domain-containing protein [Nitrospinota bacterium]